MGEGIFYFFRELAQYSCKHKYVREVMRYGGIRYKCSKCGKIKWF